MNYGKETSRGIGRLSEEEGWKREMGRERETESWRGMKGDSQITNQSGAGESAKWQREREEKKKERKARGDQTAIIREHKDELSFVCQLEG